MKNTMKFPLTILLMLIVSIPFSMTAQEEAKEKKVRIKTVKVIDGEKVVTDTTVLLTDDEDLKEVIAEMEIETDVDTDMEDIIVDVIVDSDADGETVEKIIIIKKDGDKQVKVIKGHGAQNTFTYDMDVEIDKDCEHGKKVIMVSPHSGNKKVMKWKTDGGVEYVIDVDSEHKIIMNELEGELEHLEELHIELEKLEEMENMVFIEKMESLEELEGLEDMDVRIMRAPKAPHPHHDFFFEHKTHGHHGVTDGELRDAGIKNKIDRLAIEELEIEIDNGVVDLSFSLQTEGTPKMVVYNFFGDKVFSGKPELMNEKYQIKMDLSSKQHGVYYLQIIQKNSSVTEKIRL